MSQEKACLFLHIPKCGGTTFNRILLRQYDRSRVYNIDSFGINTLASMQEFASLPLSQRINYSCIYGHMLFGIHHKLPQESAYISFVRNPVKRVISHYNFVRSNGRHYLNQKLLQENISLTDYVSKRITPEVNNGMTRQISGVMAVNPFSGEADVTDDIYRKALENIESRFAVCGTLEMFDESLLLMAEFFGWQHIYYLRKKAAKPAADKTLQPDSQTIDVIREHNHYDLHLYQFVQDRLNTEVAGAGSVFGKSLQNLKTKNKIYNFTIGKIYAFFQRNKILHSRPGHFAASLYKKYNKI